MSNSSVYRGGNPDDNPDQASPSDSQSDYDPATRHAVPAIVEYDEENGRRATLDLDATESGEREPLDLSALIGQLEAGHKRRSKRGAAPPSVSAKSSGETLHDISAGAADKAAADRAEIERLRAELETQLNNYRRAQADLVNYRRKAEQDRDRAVREAGERAIKQILPIMDDFDRGLIATNESQNYEQLAGGVQAILRNFDVLLGRYGVVPVESLGQMFDPTLHEAVAVDETSDQPDDTIVEELRKGYLIDGRLLRPAMVKVARHAAIEATEPGLTEETAAEDAEEASAESGA